MNQTQAISSSPLGAITTTTSPLAGPYVAEGGPTRHRSSSARGARNHRHKFGTPRKTQGKQLVWKIVAVVLIVLMIVGFTGSLFFH